jgi:RNase P subunit RPR2
MHKLYLTVIPPHDDTVVLVNMSNVELFRGNEDESLACGACEKVLALGVSTRTMYERITTEMQMVIKCRCGAHNRAPSTTT